MAKYFLLCLTFIDFATAQAQVPDSIYVPGIRSPQLYLMGNQLEYPVIHLNSGEQLDLHFDDLDADTKNYFYTYQLCNADWTPVEISTFDYIRGFSQIRITDYRFSSIALTRYTHYHAALPDANSNILLSGNYLLKVFLDSDTSKLVFTKRFLVVEDAVSVFAQFLQPTDPQFFQSHQKIQFTVNTRSLNLINAFQQIKVVLMQNYRWDNAHFISQPSFFSGSTFQYNSDDICIFPGGSQWRWADLQSFRFQSDRVQKADYLKTATTIYVKPDADRSPLPYYFYNDLNGLYYIQSSESINPRWQTDYATVHFSFIPTDNIPFNDKDIYLFGKMTDYKLDDHTRMRFNAGKGVYENDLFLKQGFYNYSYVTIDRNDPGKGASFADTEGNHLETENDYMILVYYRTLGGRSDQLVGLYRLNTLNNK